MLFEELIVWPGFRLYLEDDGDVNTGAGLDVGMYCGRTGVKGVVAEDVV